MKWYLYRPLVSFAEEATGLPKLAASLIFPTSSATDFLELLLTPGKLFKIGGVLGATVSTTPELLPVPTC